jgi:hypothetical protein
MLKDILPMLTAPRRSSTSKIAPAAPLQSLSGEDEFTNSEVKKKHSKSSLPILSSKSNSAKTTPYVLPGQSLPLPHHLLSSHDSPVVSCRFGSCDCRANQSSHQTCGSQWHWCGELHRSVRSLLSFLTNGVLN